MGVNPSDGGQLVVKGRAGLQSGFWHEIQWILILADVNTLCLALELAQWNPRPTWCLFFQWSVAEEDFVVRHVFSSPVGCTESK